MTVKCDCPESKSVQKLRYANVGGLWRIQCGWCDKRFDPVPFQNPFRGARVFVLEFWEGWDRDHVVRTHYRTKLGAYRAMVREKNDYWNHMRDVCPRWKEGDYTANANWEIREIALLD